MKRSRRRIELGLSVVIAAIAWPGLAGADDTPAKKPGEHWVDPVFIHGRRMRPLAVTELSRVVPTVRQPDLKQPLVQRIETAVEREPF